MSHGLLVLNTSRSWGGNEHWAVRIAAGMASRGHRVRFLWSDPVVGERVRAAGLDQARCRLRGDLDAATVLRLTRALQRHDAQTILLTKWREYLLGGLAARLAGRRAVVGLGLRVTLRDDLKRRLIFALADRVVVNAPEIRDGLLAAPWLRPERVRVVINGIDLAWHQPRWAPGSAAAGRELRARLGVPAVAPLLVNVANLTPQKDHAGLFDAVAALRTRWPEVRALVVGEGALRADLTARIERLGLQGTVLLPGFLADVRPALAAADLFVLSSRNEGMPFVLMEAAAAGLPAVTTDVSGARMCVEDSLSGLVVPGDAPALAAAIGALLDDAPRREAMGRHARRLAETRFDEARMLAETEDALFG